MQSIIFCDGSSTCQTLPLILTPNQQAVHASGWAFGLPDGALGAHHVKERGTASMSYRDSPASSFGDAYAGNSDEFSLKLNEAKRLFLFKGIKSRDSSNG